MWNYIHCNHPYFQKQLNKPKINLQHLADNRLSVMSTSDDDDTITLQIKAPGPINDLSDAFLAVKTMAVDISTSVKEITVNLTKTLELIDQQVFLFVIYKTWLRI